MDVSIFQLVAPLGDYRSTPAWSCARDGGKVQQNITIDEPAACGQTRATGADPVAEPATAAFEFGLGVVRWPACRPDWLPSFDLLYKKVANNSYVDLAMGG